MVVVMYSLGVDSLRTQPNPSIRIRDRTFSQLVTLTVHLPYHEDVYNITYVVDILGAAGASDGDE